MTREVFLQLCKLCGDQSRDESERWKDIACIYKVEDPWPMGSFQKQLSEGKIRFIDEDITVSETETVKLCGFLKISSVTPDISFNKSTQPHVTFLDIDIITHVTFNDTYGITSIDDFITKSGLIQPEEPENPEEPVEP